MEILRYVDREEFCSQTEIAEFLRIARDLDSADADAAADVLVGEWLASGWIEIAATDPEPLIGLTDAGVAAAVRLHQG